MVKQAKNRFKTNEQRRIYSRERYRLKRLQYSWADEQKMKKQLQIQQTIENGTYVHTPSVTIKIAPYILDFELV